MTMTTQPKYLTIEEASAYLRIPVQTIYQLTSTQRLRHYKPGRRVYFTHEDLDAFILGGVVPENSSYQQSRRNS